MTFIVDNGEEPRVLVEREIILDGMTHPVLFGMQMVYCDEYISNNYDVSEENDLALRRFDVLFLERDNADEWAACMEDDYPKNSSLCTGITERTSIEECIEWMKERITEVGASPIDPYAHKRLFGGWSWTTDEHLDAVLEVSK